MSSGVKQRALLLLRQRCRCTVLHCGCGWLPWKAAAAPLALPSSIPALPPALGLVQTGAAGGSGLGSSLPWVCAKRPLDGKSDLNLKNRGKLESPAG